VKNLTAETAEAAKKSKGIIARHRIPCDLSASAVRFLILSYNRRERKA
jgi:hypothetical protein